jgi:F-type H+-transporting ATPase subunit a
VIDYQQFIELVKFFTNKTCQYVENQNKKSAPASHFLMRKIFLSLSALLLTSPAAMAAGAGHDHLPVHAEELFRMGPIAISNSMLMVWIVAAVIIAVAQLATRNVALIPSGLQNFVEWLVESLYHFLEGILGTHLVRKTFWFFGTIFVLILFTNWFGLIPGVGTIGQFNPEGFGGDSHDTFRPFLRGGNADLNMTLAMSISFALLWFYWAIGENGLVGFFKHIFAPKGKFSGIMAVMMLVVFGFVGVLELVSIIFRPVALSFRLFGNIFAGETTLETMTAITGSWYTAWLPPLPFYFMELLVGLIQALVFTLLTAVFLKLICEHHDEEGHEHH